MGKEFHRGNKGGYVRGKIENEMLHKMERNRHRKDSTEDFKCL